jgi:hypothetical protein
VYTGFWWGNMMERDQLEDTDVDERLSLRRIFMKWNVDSMHWIELAQDWEMWRSLVNAVMNIRVPYNEGNFLTS